jgi:hypothetical protein
MAEDQVTANLKGMDDLDFIGWNNADWNGVFAHHHTDDVFVDWKGQAPTHGIQEHIDAMKVRGRLRSWNRPFRMLVQQPSRQGPSRSPSFLSVSSRSRHDLGVDLHRDGDLDVPQDLRGNAQVDVEGRLGQIRPD